MTRELILDGIRRCASELGRNPRLFELQRTMDVTRPAVEWHFGSYGQALREAGLKAKPRGLFLRSGQLLTDWGHVVRKLHKIPMTFEYDAYGRYRSITFRRRFQRWQRVPKMFLDFVAFTESSVDWADVIKIITGADEPTGTMTTAEHTPQQRDWPVGSEENGAGSASLTSPANTVSSSGATSIMDVCPEISGTAGPDPETGEV